MLLKASSCGFTNQRSTEVKLALGLEHLSLLLLSDCRNTDPDYRIGSVVFEHLVRRGMVPTYTTWVFHGENSSVSTQVDQDIEMTNAQKMCIDAHQLNKELNEETGNNICQKMCIDAHQLNEELCRLTLLSGPPNSGKTTMLLALDGKLNKDLKVMKSGLKKPPVLLSEYLAAVEIFMKELESCPDDWECFLDYLGCLLVAIMVMEFGLSIRSCDLSHWSFSLLADINIRI